MLKRILRLALLASLAHGLPVSTRSAPLAVPSHAMALSDSQRAEGSKQSKRDMIVVSLFAWAVLLSQSLAFMPRLVAKSRTIASRGDSAVATTVVLIHTLLVLVQGLLTVRAARALMPGQPHFPSDHTTSAPH